MTVEKNGFTRRVNSRMEELGIRQKDIVTGKIFC